MAGSPRSTQLEGTVLVAFHGRQPLEAGRNLRITKRAEAEQRNKETPVERRRKTRLGLAQTKGTDDPDK